MTRPLFRIFFYLFLVIPLTSEAGLNKCTNAAGLVTYSDQPCSAQEGLKPAEVKNETAFAMINAREHHRELAISCTRLRDKKLKCGEYVEPRLSEVFSVKCEAPIRRRALDEQRDQRWDQRRTNYREREARREREQYENDRENPVITCGDVDAVIYKFVKENFASSISAEEMKAIDYAHNAIRDVDPDAGRSGSGRSRSRSK